MYRSVASLVGVGAGKTHVKSLRADGGELV